MPLNFKLQKMTHFMCTSNIPWSFKLKCAKCYYDIKLPQIKNFQYQVYTIIDRLCKALRAEWCNFELNTSAVIRFQLGQNLFCVQQLTIKICETYWVRKQVPVKWNEFKLVVFMCKAFISKFNHINKYKSWLLLTLNVIHSHNC